MSPPADKIGRKVTLLVTTILYLSTSVVLVLANSVWVFCVVRAIIGIAIGLSVTVTPLYLGEISQATTRGAANTIMYMLQLVGFLFINFAGARLSIKVTSWILVGLSLTMLVACMCLPESPYYLILVKKDDESKAALRKLQGTQDVDQDFERIKVGVEEQKKAKFRDVVKDNRRALLILVLVLSSKELVGDGVVDTYSQTIFSTIYGKLSPEIVSVIYYTTTLIFTTSAVFFVDKIGRRCLLLTSVFVVALLSLVFGVYITLKVRTCVKVPTEVENSIVVLIIIYGIFDSCLFTVGAMTLSELFPMNTKSLAARVYGIYIFGSLFLTTSFFQVTSDRVGMDVPFFVFAACGFVFFVLLYIFMFESSGKTLEQIQEELSKL